MALRTIADVEAEYAAVRTAYLSAVKSAGYSINTGQGGRSQQNQSVVDLRDQMKSLEKERGRLSNGGKIIVKGITPL